MVDGLVIQDEKFTVFVHVACGLCQRVSCKKYNIVFSMVPKTHSISNTFQRCQIFSCYMYIGECGFHSSINLVTDVKSIAASGREGLC